MVWADWTVLKQRYPHADITDEQYQEAVASASWMLNVLTNGMLHGEETWVEEYRLSNTCEIILRRAPLIEVFSVEKVQSCGRIAPEVLSSTDYCLPRRQTISFCCGTWNGGGSFWNWCGCGDDALRITYKIGSNLPPGTEGVVMWLAEQFLRSQTGDTCSLPERITSITRQGVSWTVLDAMDFLDKGLTGMAPVDQWISVVRRAYPPVAIIDPIRSERLISYRIGSQPTTVDVQPLTVDLKLYEGDDFSMDIVVTNPDGTPAVVGTPLAQIRATTDSPVLATFTTTVLDNMIHLYLPGTLIDETLDGVWDCQVTDDQGQVTTLVAGSVVTTAEVTRAAAVTSLGVEPEAGTTLINWGET